MFFFVFYSLARSLSMGGEGVEQDYAEAAKWYRKAAEQGVGEAQFNLGGCYYKGQGVEQDYKEAVKWFSKAADQGVAEAQHSLGICYENGHGVAQDMAEAEKWFRKAEEQGAGFSLPIIVSEDY